MAAPEHMVHRLLFPPATLPWAEPIFRKFVPVEHIPDWQPAIGYQPVLPGGSPAPLAGLPPTPPSPPGPPSPPQAAACPSGPCKEPCASTPNPCPYTPRTSSPTSPPVHNVQEPPPPLGTLLSHPTRNCPQDANQNLTKYWNLCDWGETKETHKLQ